MTVITSEVYQIPSPEMNFTMGFGLYYENFTMATENFSQYLDLKLNYVTNRGTSNKTKKAINLRKCEKSDWVNVS